LFRVVVSRQSRIVARIALPALLHTFRTPVRNLQMTNVGRS
jgi:hypothetical protein